VTEPTIEATDHVADAAAELGRAAGAKKCWSCGCLRDTLDAIDRAFPNGGAPVPLRTTAANAREHVGEIKYDCLGCKVCYPAVAVNHLNQLPGAAVDLDPCPAGELEPREGWPPLPGDYQVIRYRAPVAVCTLTDGDLAATMARSRGDGVAMVGTLQTENLGIERVIANVVENPNIRFLVLCGPDSEQRIGHLPGQSMLALVRNGTDERGRILGAEGKRPVVKNLSASAVEYFREHVEVIDRIGTADSGDVRETVRSCVSRDPGPAGAFRSEPAVAPVWGRIPERMTPDPKGYFVVYVDPKREVLSVEHYHRSGVISAIIEGRTAGELYTTAIEEGLVSRLDHSAYLGRELARAEHSLITGEPYVQDGAPEREADATNCACSSCCKGEKP